MKEVKSRKLYEISDIQAKIEELTEDEDEIL
jgi:hypothetical protein